MKIYDNYFSVCGNSDSIKSESSSSDNNHRIYSSESKSLRGLSTVEVQKQKQIKMEDVPLETYERFGGSLKISDFPTDQNTNTDIVLDNLIKPTNDTIQIIDSSHDHPHHENESVQTTNGAQSTNKINKTNKISRY